MRRFGLSAVVVATVMSAVSASAQAKATVGGRTVSVGLEVIEAEHGGFLKGRKAGLIAHSGSVTIEGRHAIDVLRDAGVDVVRIFSPERAVRVRGAMWDKVPTNLDGTPWNERTQGPIQTWADIGTGLPIVGLFGEKAWLRREDLSGLDVLVFDLQDAGVRLSTYTGLLVLAMDAAAAAGIEFVVLDRPDPLGGEQVDGPESERWGPRAASITSVAPGPFIPGLTAGEMAQLVNARRDRPARLRVVPMKGWRRGMLWPDTGRKWAAPSPNLRSFEAALAYAGVGLVEATTASEGRGTDSPFLLVGAPSLDAARLLSIPAAGWTLSRASFTPRRSVVAVRPKHADEPCQGVRLAMVNPRSVRPYQLGVALLHALRGQSVAWKSPTALDELLGTRSVRTALDRHESVAAILGADAAAAGAFKTERSKLLLY